MGTRGIIRRAALAAVVLVLALAAACGGDDGGSGGSGDTGSLVPQRANLVGTAALDQALNEIDLDLDQFLGVLPADSQGDDEGFGDFLGIEAFQEGGLFGKIDRADLFGEVTDSEDVEYFGLLLTGGFNEPEMIAGLESASGVVLVSREYKGSNVYSLPEDDDDFELSVLDDNTLAVGGGGAINDIIDIKAGDADSASGPLMETFSGLSGGLFALAVEVPAGFADDAGLGDVPELGDLPISLDFISAIDILGLAGDLNGGNVELTVTLDFTDEDSAESLEQFINGIVTLAGGFLADPDTAGLLEGLEVDRDGSVLTVKIALPVADIPDIFGDLVTPAGVETFTPSGPPPGTPDVRLLGSVIGEPVPIATDSTHVPEGQRVSYGDSPPTSGRHWPTSARCGFYQEALPDERVVHNLEHGNMVVSYNLTNPAQVTILRVVLEEMPQFEEWGVARSYDRIPNGQVAIAAWGQLHRMDGISPAELGLFFEAFAGNNGPERFTC